MKTFLIWITLLCGGLCFGQTWLSLPAATGYMVVGDLDVPGTQLTVEALYTSTNPASVDLVSKHASPADVNYLLRQTHGELSTTSGFSSTPSICPVDQNTCRHAAMVYDGANLRFYLNGQLNGQIAFTGNMMQNNHQALVGNYGCCFGGEQFYGFIDEVRIWNVARTQLQIQSFMFAPLPTPTTQVGLQAYYSYSSLTNLQGNPAWNGSLGGTASIATVNPFCGALTTVCAILGGGFDRFTVDPQPNALQLDWEWVGSQPQYFELQMGNDPDSMETVQSVDPDRRSLQLAMIPQTMQWIRIAARTTNGESIPSNAVQFVPSKAALDVRWEATSDRVIVRVPERMEVTWRVMDMTGRMLASGSQAAEGDFVLPIAPQIRGMLLVQVSANGLHKSIKIRH